MIRDRWLGLGARIGLVALGVAAAAVCVVGLGVFVFGAALFEQLMVEHGATVESSRSMFAESVTRTFIAAVAVAFVASISLATILARRIAAPLREMSAAARRVAEGDYAARVQRGGPEEIASLADSFNQMAERLDDQERLRREFIANAAHELRTPLTNLQGYLEALRDGVVSADRATFESLHDEADRLVRLSRSLDALAEGDIAAQPPTLAELDLSAAIAAAIELVVPAFERQQITLRVEIPPRLRARANADHLAQVLANLLQNASRYTPAHGNVLITAEGRPGDVLVTIANTGDGIPSADLPHVFERFYRVEKSRDRARGGAGIGLAIVKRLVELGGGRVGADSVPGLTRFWFSVPG